MSTIRHGQLALFPITQRAVVVRFMLLRQQSCSAAHSLEMLRQEPGVAVDELGQVAYLHQKAESCRLLARILDGKVE